MRGASLLLIALLLPGCDKLTGAADQKIADAEAIGFACRVSSKTPEECMKENEAQSPSSILDGWKSADEDIKAGKLDPGMKNIAAPATEGEAAPEGEAPAEGEAKPAAEGEPKKDEAKKDEAGEAKKAEGKETAAKEQDKAQP